MAERFNITAQIQLQAPTNVNNIVRDLNRQLSSIGAVNVKVQSDAKSLATANKQFRDLNKGIRNTTNSTSSLNRTLQESARRFSVITIATGTLLALANAFKNSVKGAISFEREMIRISQVTGKTVSQLQGLSQEVTRLSTSLGANSAELLLAARTLSQAGFSAQKTKQALDILAKTTLGATFQNLQDTTEGAIALLRQFRSEAIRAGSDAKFLENSLDAINSVSKSFAVESADLITVVRKVGGVFSAAGGSVNELIALFTSVRSTTRESADTISTGLRTIFTRIQRAETVGQLKELGIQLQDSRGHFVGAFEAFKRLSEGLSGLNPRDFRFSQIVEQLGGFRQIGKVIPLIQQFTVAQDALNVAQNSSGSINKDAITAQSALATQLSKTKQEFDALIRKFSDSEGFRSLAVLGLKLADAFLKIASALEPLIPLLGILFATKVGAGFGRAIGSFMGASKNRGGSGPITKFASGGMVPGTGNYDTVPAMLTPGEFVIKKSSVQKMGANNLAAMNKNRYAGGGKAVAGIVSLRPWEEEPTITTKNQSVSRSAVAQKAGVVKTGAALGRAVGQNPGKFTGYFGDVLKQFANKSSINVTTVGAAMGDASIGRNFEAQITQSFVDSINDSAGTLARFFGSKPTEMGYADAQTLGVDSVIGNAFEGVMASLGAPFDDKGGNNAAFDFVRGIGRALAAKLDVGALGQLLAEYPTDAKRTLTSTNLKEAATKKFKNQLADEFREGYLPSADKKGKYTQESLLGFYNTKKGPLRLTDFQNQGKFTNLRQADLENAGFTKKYNRWSLAGKASGGSISGSDTVPAMLTPGEFVFSKSAAQGIGYSKLNSMNKNGVRGYAAGGVVGYNKGDRVREQLEHNIAVAGPSNKFTQMGGDMGVKAAVAEINELKAAFEELGLSGDDLEEAMGAVTNTVREGGSQLDAFDAAIDQLGATVEERTSRGEVRAASAKDLTSANDLAQDVFAGNAEERAGLKGAVQAGPQEDQRAVQNQVAAMQEREIQAIAEKIRSADITTTQEEAVGRAYQVVEQKYGKLATATDTQIVSAEDLEKSQEELAKRNKEAGLVTAGEAHGADQKAERRKAFEQKKQGFGDQANKMAGAAQQFIFLAGAATALTSQMSGLDDATKQAINQTAAFAASIIGIGATLTQTITSMITANALSTTTEVEESGANVLAVTTENAESAANAKNAASGAGMATTFGVIAFAVVAAVSALQFFSARNKAIAEQARKDWKAAGKAIQEGETTDTSTLKDGIKQEMEARQRSELQMSYSAMGIAAGYAVAGAALGQMLIPIPILGAAIGGLIGAVAGVTTAMSMTEIEMDQQAEARQRELDSMNYLIDSFASLAHETNSVKDTMNHLASVEGLSDERRLQITQEQTGRGLSAGKDTIGQTGTAAQFNAVQNEMTGIAKRLGVGSSELIGADDAKIESLADAAGLDGAETAAELQKFRLAVMNTETTMTAAQQNLQFASDGMKLALESADPSKTFDELIAEGGAFAKSFGQQSLAIQDMGDIRERAARQEVSSIRDMGGSAEAIAAAEDKYRAAVEQSEQKLALFGEGIRTTLMVREQERLAIEAATAAQISLVKRLRETAKAREKIQLRGQRIEADTQRIRDTQAISTNQTIDFDVSDIPALNDVSNVTDIKALNASIQNLARSTGDPVIAREGVQLSRAVTALSKAKGLVGQEFEISDDLIPSDILASLGITREDFGSPGAFEQAEQALREQKGKVTEEGLKKIFAGLITQADSQAGIFKDIVDVNKKDLERYKATIDAQQEQRKKELAAMEKMNQIRDKNAQIMAKVTGIGATPEVNQMRRVQGAQMRLDAGQAGRGGLKIKANDIRGTAAQMMAAKAERAEIIKRKQALKDSGLTEQEQQRVKKELIDRDKELVNTVADTTKELERMGDQAAAAADIQSKLDSERSSRAAQTQLVQDFVVGGGEQRQKMLDAAQGVFQAIETGTLQNQNPEQRQATIGLLDKLGDFMVGTTGMTAKQIKKELIFKDAIKMGLPPDVARAMALGTTKEEQLINALEHLTLATERSTAALALSPALPLASGGAVYRAGGGSIFKPRGTDTVPAMLTPGEFVIRKSAVDKIGAGNLAALNNGGGPVYRAQGGPINAGNAQFAGQTGKISIMSGSQYLSLVRNSLRAFGTAKNLANFIKNAEPEINNGHQMAKDIRYLDSKGEFNISRVVAGKQTANTLDAIASSPLLRSASGGGLGLTPPPFNPKDAPNKANKMLAQNYQAQLGVMMASMSQAKGLDRDPSEQLASHVVKKVTGMHINDMVVGAVNKIREMSGFIDIWLAGNMANNPGQLDAFEAARQAIQGQGDPAAKAEQGFVSQMTGKKMSARTAKAINNLREAGVYMNTGGGVSGNDSVPAMLTPGEFVMSPEAVQKHGVGFMRNLNRGKAKGFRRGGLVGGVAYRANGSSGAESGGGAEITINPTLLQEVLNNFSATFTANVDNIVANFSLVSGAINGLIAQFSQGMTLNHVFSGDMTLAFSIQNADHLKNAIADAISPTITNIITTELDKRLNKDFKAG